MATGLGNLYEKWGDDELEDPLFSYGLLCMGSILVAIFLSYCISKLWLWYVVPLGVRAIGKAHAYGILLLVGLLRIYSHGVSTEGKDTQKSSYMKTAGKTVGYLIACALVLLIGYLFKGFV